MSQPNSSSISRRPASVSAAVGSEWLDSIWPGFYVEQVIAGPRSRQRQRHRYSDCSEGDEECLKSSSRHI